MIPYTYSVLALFLLGFPPEPAKFTATGIVNIFARSDATRDNKDSVP